MAVQGLTYKKISQLPSVTTVSNNDVLVINSGDTTSKIKYSDLLSAIKTAIGDVTALTERVTVLEQSQSSIATQVADNKTSIDNIVTSAFNLIGVE